MRGVFITGTDTSVGKTVVAAALLHRYREQASLRYWKPIQTGTEQSDDTRDVRRLGMCGESEVLDSGVRLPHPLSPHLAARLNKTEIDLPGLVAIASLLDAREREVRWVVEGAGGALVPVNETEFMTDLMKKVSLPILVVGRSGLGTINHTLMTLESLRRRDLVVAGLVMVGAKNSANRDAIENFGDVRVIGELPVLSPLTPDTLGAWARAELDPDGLLMEYLQ